MLPTLPMDVLPNILAHFSGPALLRARLVTKTWNEHANTEIMLRVVRNPSLASFNVTFSKAPPVTHYGLKAERSNGNGKTLCVTCILFEKDPIVPRPWEIWTDNVFKLLAWNREMAKLIAAEPDNTRRNQSIKDRAWRNTRRWAEGLAELRDARYGLAWPECRLGHGVVVTSRTGQYVLGKGTVIPQLESFLGCISVCFTKPVQLGWKLRKGLEVKGKLRMLVTNLDPMCLLVCVTMDVACLLSITNLGKS